MLNWAITLPLFHQLCGRGVLSGQATSALLLLQPFDRGVDASMKGEVGRTVPSSAETINHLVPVEGRAAHVDLQLPLGVRGTSDGRPLQNRQRNHRPRTPMPDRFD